MDYDFTEGSISKKLIKFTLPILLALILQLLYGAVDLLIVGNFALASDISAVSTGFQFISVFINLIAGLAMGSTILIGQKIGSKENRVLGEVIGSALFIFLIISILMTIVLGFNGNFFASLINAPKEAFAKTSSYISVLGFGSIFLVAYNVLGSIFRGLGDSKTPLYAVIMATVINIILDYIFVAIFATGAFGAAVATVIAQALSVALSLFVILRRKKTFTISFQDVGFHKVYTKKTISLGAPLAINSFLVSLSFTFILGIVNKFGVVASAGVGVTERLIGFLMLIPMSFGQAISSFTAQNVGANKHERAKKGLTVAMSISTMAAIVMVVVSLLFGKQMLGIFSRDPLVIIPAFEYLKSYCFDIFFTAFLFTSIGFFNGYGLTKFTMISGILGALAIRIPVAYLFSTFKPVSIFLIGLGTPIGTLFQLILSYFYFRIIQKNIIKKSKYSEDRKTV